jgi:alpha-tubulin suppressor-like RCC1 family protein
MRKSIKILLLIHLAIVYNAFSQDIEIQNINVILPQEKSYVPYENDNSTVSRFTQFIRTNSWHLTKDLFSDINIYQNFIEQFLYDKDNAVSIKLKKEGNSSLISRLRPFIFKSNEGNIIKLSNTDELLEAELTLALNSENLVSSINVNFIPQNKNARIAAIPASLYGLLPDKTESSLLYYSNYLDLYKANKSISSEGNQTIPFKQIDFSPLKIKFKVCKKVIGISFCKESTYEYQYGKVISGIDIPGNENYFWEKYFDDITDVTAFNNFFSSSYTPNGYVQTAVIVDKKGKQLSFFREGLEPWQYGNGAGDYKFTLPIAVKSIGNFLYVLDQGNTMVLPKIVVLKINHSADGNYSISQAGTITSSDMGGYNLSSPTDIGGFENGTINNFLVLSDTEGIKVITIDRNTGLSTSQVKKITEVQDPYNSNNQIQINDINRLDATTASGSLVALTNSNRIISISINDIKNFAATNTLFSFYTYLQAPYYPSNLAYMFTEQKWYVTDYNGKIHTLSKEGRYLGGGGQIGTSEDNNELYLPNGITPNTIEDPANDFRYRFIVANKWGYTTGIKLFAPALIISDFKIFENINSGNLIFTFTTSGRWQTVEKAIGMSFSGLKVNGINIPQTQINSQNELISYPNIIDLSPSLMTTALRRGWNQASVELVIVKKDGLPNEVVSKQIDFYWLPSSFTPTGVLTNTNFILNQNSSLNGIKKDFIYKPIVLGDKAALSIPAGGKVKVSEYGRINFSTGSTFHNISNSLSPFSNIEFSDTSKFIFANGAYICTNVPSGISAKSFSAPDLKKNINLGPTYILGINPNAPWPANTLSQCITPCLFYESNKINVDFKTTVNLASGPSFSVLVDPSGTTYSNRYRWEVQKIVNPGQDSMYKSIILNGAPTITDLKQLLNYQFVPCSQYKITLSIACNQTQWLKSSSKTILMYTDVNAGKDTTVCNNSPTVQLIGYTPTNGLWTGSGVNSSGLFSISGKPLNTPIGLSYTVTDTYGCVKSDIKQITILPTPATPAVTGKVTYCVGDTIILNSNVYTNATYIWSVSTGYQFQQSSNRLVLPAIKANLAGDYKVSVKVNGCTSLASPILNVIVNPLPIVNAGVDKEVCLNTAAYQLTGSPTGGSWTGKGIQSVNYFNPAVATYGKHNLIYSFTDIKGCKSKDTVAVTVGPLVIAGDSEQTCLNNAPYTLAGFSPSGGIWSSSGVSSSGVFNPPIAGIGIKTLNYSYTNASGCQNSAKKIITVKSLPSPGLASSSKTIICIGEDIKLTATATGVTKYIWTGPNNYIAEGANVVIPFPGVEMSGNYKVNVIGTNGCTNSDPVNSQVFINVKPLPIVGAGIDKTVCSNASALNLSGTPTLGKWSGNSVTSSSDLQFNDAFASTTLNPKWTIVDTDNWTGSRVSVNGSVQIEAAGMDVFGSSNQFMAIRRSDITGDFDVSIKVISQINSNVSAKAGIMAANNIGTLSQGGYCYVAVTPGNGFIFGSDNSGILGEIETFVQKDVTSYPCWLRLQKQGTTFAAFYKKTETAPWIRIGASTFTPQSGIANSQVALFATSKNTSANTAVFMDDFNGGREVAKFTPNTSIAGQNNLAYNYTDINGCSNSDLAIYTVNPVPTVDIVSNVDATTCAGGFTNAQLVASPNGTPPITYQWLKNSAAVTGATAQTYTTTSIGNYCVNATMSCGVAQKCFNLNIVNNWKYLHANSYTSFGIKNDGSLWGWGDGSYGILGDGVDGRGHYVTSPIKCGITNDWEKVYSFYNCSHGIKNDGTLWTWGENYAGKCGITRDMNNHILQPLQVTTSVLPNTFTDVSCGAVHCVSRKTNGTIWSWGFNSYGQLGVGPKATGTTPTLAETKLPQQIGSETTWKMIVAGEDYTIAIKTDGSLWAWGSNSYGQLGNPALGSFVTVPTRIGTDNDWIFIESSDLYSNFGIKTNGSLWAWGLNFLGQFGNGNENSSSVPIQIGNDYNWLKVKAGAQHTLAQKNDQTLWGFGTSDGGQLGLGYTANNLTPLKIEPSEIYLFAAGMYHSLIVRNCTDNFCSTGDNVLGQLGTGTIFPVDGFCGTTNGRIGNESIHFLTENRRRGFMSQNYPNPSLTSSKVNYFIPEASGNASIVFYDIVKGSKVHESSITEIGFGSIEINVQDMAPGVYPYSLIINDKIVKTLMMLVVK